MCHHLRTMRKAKAITLLAGKYGTPTEAARMLGISRQAVYKWPDPLPRKVERRVVEFLDARRTAKQEIADA